MSEGEFFSSQENSIRGSLFREKKQTCIQRNPCLQTGLMDEQISKCDVLFHQSICKIAQTAPCESHNYRFERKKNTYDHALS
jgi:hypothetical protein